MKTIPRDYTSEELERGEGMVFHPLTGNALSILIWSENLHEFFHPAWYEIFPWWCGLQGKIGAGRALRAGDPYPDHWKFDPYSGEKLIAWHSSTKLLVRLCEGSTVMHSRGGYLFLCESRGSPWYWIEPFSAGALADLLCNLQTLWRKGQTHSSSFAVLTGERWRALVTGAETMSVPVTNAVPLERTHRIVLEGENGRLETWIRCFTPPKWD